MNLDVVALMHMNINRCDLFRVHTCSPPIRICQRSDEDVPADPERSADGLPSWATLPSD